MQPVAMKHPLGITERCALHRAVQRSGVIVTILILAGLRHQYIPTCISGGTAYACLRASIAASTFGGDIGSSVSRRPTARSIALAMAAIGGQMLTSAAPLAP